MGNSGKGELIETLWNVNLTSKQAEYLQGCELIETLWNVNKDGCEYVAVDFRINRNIVECKWWTGAAAASVVNVELIETLWNVNILIYPFGIFILNELIETLWNVNTNSI